MALPQLTKHTAESKLYSFEFGPWGGVSSVRDTVMGSTLPAGALQSGETFLAALAPLGLGLLFSLVSSLAAATIAVSRSDGNTSDLTVGAPSVFGPTRIQARISGGTAGFVYTITVSVPTSLGNVVVVQGQLAVVSVLP